MLSVSRTNGLQINISPRHNLCDYLLLWCLNACKCGCWRMVLQKRFLFRSDTFRQKRQFIKGCEASVCRSLLHWHMLIVYQRGGSEIQRCLPQKKLSSSPIFPLVNSWWLATCGQSTLALRPAASRHPPDTGLSCSNARCAGARWTPRMLAWPGKGQRRDGWPRAGGCPELSSCHRAVALLHWWTSRGRGRGERSLCPLHMTPASTSSGKNGNTARCLQPKDKFL